MTIAEAAQQFRDALSDQPKAWAALPGAAELLGIPDTYKGVFPIASNLLVLRTDVEALLGSAASRAKPIFDFAAGVEAIPADAPARFKEVLTVRRRPGGFYDPPVYGTYQSNPVWAAIWFRHYREGAVEPGQSRYLSLYRYLQANYLAAHLLLHLGGAHVSRLRKVRAGLAVRTLHSPEWAYVLDYLASGIQGVKPLYHTLRHCDQWLTDSDEYAIHYGLRCLAELIRLAHGFNDDTVFFRISRGSGETRQTHRRRRRVGSKRIGPDHGYYWLLEREWGLGGVQETDGLTEICTPTGGAAKAIGDSGGIPDEYRRRGGSVWVDRRGLSDNADGSLGELPPLWSVLAAARARARRMRMGVQRLRTDVARVREAEIAELLHAMAAEYRDYADWQPSRNEDEKHRVQTLRCLRVAAAAIVTGTPPHAIISRYGLQLVQSVGELPSSYELGLNVAHRMWFRPYDPPERQPMRVAESGGAVEIWPRVAYPDVWSVAGNTTDDDDPSTWKSHRLDTLQRRWDAFIHRTTFSYAREKWRQYDALGHILPSWWRAREEGEHLSGRLLYRTSDPLASVQHHYTTYDREALAQRYMDRIYALGERLGLPSPEDVEGPTLFATERRTWTGQASFVGDDRVLRIESIRDLVADVRAQVDAKLDVLSHHNWMAIYTGLGLAVATGYRAVRTPIVDLMAIDRHTRMICLQEKDRNDGQGSRMVPLPDAVYDQVQAYLHHLRKLWLQLPSTYEASIDVLATKRRDWSAYGSDRYTLALNRNLFLFEQSTSDGQVHPVEFTGERLREQLNSLRTQTWPTANAGRHGLATWLTNAGADPTCVNALMGHAYFGEEAWAPHSAVDPVALRTELVPHLDQLTEVLDYRVVTT